MILNTSNYKIIHTQNFPSKVYDYDYDPDAPDRRFLSTLVHHLRFFDKITESEIISFTFTYEVYEDLIRGLKLMTTNPIDGVCVLGTNNGGHSFGLPLVLSIGNIFVDGNFSPIILVLTHQNYKVRMTASNTSISLIFDTNDIANLVSMMESDVQKASDVLLQYG